eukprot:scaffold7379_cov126-Isochrysis_galbana.AAC.9
MRVRYTYILTYAYASASARSPSFCVGRGAGRNATSPPPWPFERLHLRGYCGRRVARAACARSRSLAAACPGQGAEGDGGRGTSRRFPRCTDALPMALLGVHHRVAAWAWCYSNQGGQASRAWA